MTLLSKLYPFARLSLGIHQRLIEKLFREQARVARENEIAAILQACRPSAPPQNVDDETYDHHGCCGGELRVEQREAGGWR